jgi:hypothetical protein
MTVSEPSVVPERRCPMQSITTTDMRGIFGTTGGSGSHRTA